MSKTFENNMWEGDLGGFLPFKSEGGLGRFLFSGGVRHMQAVCFLFFVKKVCFFLEAIFFCIFREREILFSGGGFFYDVESF